MRYEVKEEWTWQRNKNNQRHWERAKSWFDPWYSENRDHSKRSHHWLAWNLNLMIGHYLGWQSWNQPSGKIILEIVGNKWIEIKEQWSGKTETGNESKRVFRGMVRCMMVWISKYVRMITECGGLVNISMVRYCGSEDLMIGGIMREVPS